MGEVLSSPVIFLVHEKNGPCGYHAVIVSGRIVKWTEILAVLREGEGRAISPPIVVLHNQIRIQGFFTGAILIALINDELCGALHVEIVLNYARHVLEVPIVYSISSGGYVSTYLWNESTMPPDRLGPRWERWHL